MLYHTSYESNIDWTQGGGRFGDFAFFAEKGCHYGDLMYSIDEENLKIADLDELYFEIENQKIQFYIERVSEIANCDSEQSLEYLFEREFYIDDAEISWDIQIKIAEMCEFLGFDAVKVNDEHGSSYMINTKKLNTLIKEIEEMQ